MVHSSSSFEQSYWKAVSGDHLPIAEMHMKNPPRFQPFPRESVQSASTSSFSSKPTRSNSKRPQTADASYVPTRQYSSPLTDSSAKSTSHPWFNSDAPHTHSMKSSLFRPRPPVSPSSLTLSFSPRGHSRSGSSSGYDTTATGHLSGTLQSSSARRTKGSCHSAAGSVAHQLDFKRMMSKPATFLGAKSPLLKSGTQSRDDFSHSLGTANLDVDHVAPWKGTNNGMPFQHSDHTKKSTTSLPEDRLSSSEGLLEYQSMSSTPLPNLGFYKNESDLVSKTEYPRRSRSLLRRKSNQRALRSTPSSPVRGVSIYRPVPKAPLTPAASLVEAYRESQRRREELEHFASGQQLSLNSVSTGTSRHPASARVIAVAESHSSIASTPSGLSQVVRTLSHKASSKLSMRQLKSSTSVVPSKNEGISPKQIVTSSTALTTEKERPVLRISTDFGPPGKRSPSIVSARHIESVRGASFVLETTSKETLADAELLGSSPRQSSKDDDHGPPGRWTGLIRRLSGGVLRERSLTRRGILPPSRPTHPIPAMPAIPLNIKDSAQYLGGKNLDLTKSRDSIGQTCKRQKPSPASDGRRPSVTPTILSTQRSSEIESSSNLVKQSLCRSSSSHGQLLMDSTAFSKERRDARSSTTSDTQKSQLQTIQTSKTRSDSPLIPSFSHDNSVNQFHNDENSLSTMFSASSMHVGSVRSPYFDQSPLLDNGNSFGQPQNAGQMRSSVKRIIGGPKTAIHPRKSLDATHSLHSKSRDMSSLPLGFNRRRTKSMDKADTPPFTPVIFRELNSQQRQLSEQEKMDRWEELLKRSELAGGTLHASVTPSSLLSDSPT